MGRRCTVCVRADRSKIDVALALGSSPVGVARAHHLEVRAIYRHVENEHVPGLVKPPPKSIRPTVSVAEVEHLRAQASAPIVKPQASAPAAEPVLECVSLRTPDDVLAALEWSVAETKALFGRAKDAGNLELQNRLLLTAIGALDKLAKANGVYSDGTTITVNMSERRMERAVAKLSDAQVDAGIAAFARGEQIAIEGEVLG